ncbi:MAG: RNA-binding S4 domain-containing protein [Pseudohongiella sp.]|nr:RNA-binding S4 domain-containing protein [Pseudohongiella sp.]
MRVITVNTVPVELYKILKFEGLVSSGAEAKAAVAEGLVKVNGEIETRKRKIILAGDLIEFGSETLRIVLDDTPQVD